MASLRLALLVALLACWATPGWAAVAFQAQTTGGNGTGGLSQQCDDATSCSSTGHTVASGATLLTVTLACQFSPSAFNGTWAGQALTVEASGSNSGQVAVILRRVSPTAGTGPLIVNWTGTADCYMASQSWTGTDTTTGVNAAHNVTGTASPLTITSAGTDATLAVLSINGDTPVMNQTTLWGNQALAPGGGASYALGGSSNQHTFTNGSGTTRALAGVHILVGGPPDTTPPTDPSGLTAQGPTSSVITLAVGGACTDLNPVTYLLERSAGATCTGFSQVATSATPAFTDSGLAASTTRCYRVRCTDGPNFSNNYTNTASATTLAPQAIVKLHWTDLSSDESNFAIHACEPVYPATTCDPATAGAQIATVGAGVVDFTWNTAASNPLSCLGVTAQKVGASDSGFTNTVCTAAGGNPPVPPDSLSVGGITAPLLVWRDLSTDETGFPIEERVGCGSGSYAEIAEAPANATSFPVPAAAGTVTQYRLRARSAIGDSTYTNEVCWSRWQHSTLGAPGPHGTRPTPGPHGSLP